MPFDELSSQDPRLWETTRRDAGEICRELADQGIVGLTVLWHPDHHRVGEEAGLTSLSDDGEELSRLAPHFVAHGGKPRPLTDPHLSRKPLRLVAASDDGVLRIEPGGTVTEVDGALLTEPREVSAQELEVGVVLLLARRVVLLLHLLPLPPGRPPSYEGLIGESAAMLLLREEIRYAADHDAPVLLRGESGTGKELVARALHQGGKRYGQRLVPVNVGSLGPERAVADLFGAVRGAYTGATRDKPGFFKAADGGTLFLDEIGEAPIDVQILLLRVLEDSEIYPLGTVEPVPIDVRVISATDADLSAAMREKRFHEPLYHRLATCQLKLPPLRDRRADFGRLFLHFLKQELETVGKSRHLERGDEETPWVPARLVARLASYRWPGNVRELRNKVRQLVIFNCDKEELSIPDRLFEKGEALEHEPEAEPRPTRKKRPEDFGESEVRRAMCDACWHVDRSAEALGMSSASLYNVMAKYGIRTAGEFSREEIEGALRQSEGRVDEAARLLEVSKRGLTLQMTKLQIQ